MAGLAVEEFCDVAVVLHCEDHGFLGMLRHVDPVRLQALDPDLDIEALTAALDGVDDVCAGCPLAWPAAPGRPGARFGWLAALRSPVLQPGPIRGGLTSDPAGELHRLAACLLA